MSRVKTRTLRALSLPLGLVLALGTLTLTSPTVATAAPDRVTATTAVGSCAGFKNKTGITNRYIRIGNASDLSGPVPGLFRSAQLATKAYVAYFNSTRNICGRKLLLSTYDTRTDAGGNLDAYRDICADDFAAVGSMSAFDAGGAADTQLCRLPDLRVASTSNARNACATCFGINATRAGEAPNSVPDYFVAKHPADVAKAAFLYLNAGSAPQAAATQQKVAQARGYTFVYTQAIDVADFNYGPYVAQLKSKGVQVVHFLGAYQQTVRLAQAMQNASYQPKVFVVGPDSYTPQYAQTGGTAVTRSIVPINFLPLNANQTELNLYRKWLDRVSPGAKPTAAGLYAWSAAKLFTTQAAALGAKLSRTNLNVRLRTVNTWTGGGLHVPQQVGTKHVSGCTRLLYLQNGTWISIGGTAYRCTGVTKVS